MGQASRACAPRWRRGAGARGAEAKETRRERTRVCGARARRAERRGCSDEERARAYETKGGRASAAQGDDRVAGHPGAGGRQWVRATRVKGRGGERAWVLSPR